MSRDLFRGYTPLRPDVADWPLDWPMVATNPERIRTVKEARQKREQAAVDASAVLGSPQRQAHENAKALARAQAVAIQAEMRNALIN